MGDYTGEYYRGYFGGSFWVLQNRKVEGRTVVPNAYHSWHRTHPRIGLFLDSPNSLGFRIYSASRKPQTLNLMYPYSPLVNRSLLTSTTEC